MHGKDSLAADRALESRPDLRSLTRPIQTNNNHVHCTYGLQGMQSWSNNLFLSPLSLSLSPLSLHSLSSSSAATCFPILHRGIEIWFQYGSYFSSPSRLYRTVKVTPVLPPFSLMSSATKLRGMRKTVVCMPLPRVYSVLPLWVRRGVLTTSGNKTLFPLPLTIILISVIVATLPGLMSGERVTTMLKERSCSILCDTPIH